ncbi:hypothetical protein FB451DRAFT_1180002 [Mycena latifolia]|nr:hypothetical protein FB451DRAFT_1180002 [Mycena latifolia]
MLALCLAIRGAAPPSPPRTPPAWTRAHVAELAAPAAGGSLLPPPPSSGTRMHPGGGRYLKSQSIGLGRYNIPLPLQLPEVFFIFCAVGPESEWLNGDQYPDQNISPCEQHFWKIDPQLHQLCAALWMHWTCERATIALVTIATRQYQTEGTMADDRPRIIQITFDRLSDSFGKIRTVIGNFTVVVELQNGEKEPREVERSYIWPHLAQVDTVQLMLRWSYRMGSSKAYLGRRSEIPVPKKEGFPRNTTMHAQVKFGAKFDVALACQSLKDSLASGFRTKDDPTRDNAPVVILSRLYSDSADEAFLPCWENYATSSRNAINCHPRPSGPDSSGLLGPQLALPKECEKKNRRVEFLGSTCFWGI